MGLTKVPTISIKGPTKGEATGVGIFGDDVNQT